MIIRSVLLGGTALLTAAAAPRYGLDTSPMLPPVVSVSPQILGAPQILATPKTPPGFEPAPLPNRDALAPVTRASKDASVSPGFFTRRDQYRGEGLAAGNSAQIEQDRRSLPGAGINLSMPLQ